MIPTRASARASAASNRRMRATCALAEKIRSQSPGADRSLARYVKSKNTVSASPCRTMSNRYCRVRPASVSARAMSVRRRTRGDERQYRIGRGGRLVLEVDPREEVVEQPTREHSDRQVRRLTRRGIEWKALGLHRREREPSQLVRADARESSGLPHLDHRVRNASAVAIDHASLHADHHLLGDTVDRRHDARRRAACSRERTDPPSAMASPADASRRALLALLEGRGARSVEHDVPAPAERPLRLGDVVRVRRDQSRRAHSAGTALKIGSSGSSGSPGSTSASRAAAPRLARAARSGCAPAATRSGDSPTDTRPARTVRKRYSPVVGR